MLGAVPGGTAATAAGYFSWLEKAVANAGGNFPQVSLDTYEAETPTPLVTDPNKPVLAGISHWWLNANPKIWDFRNAAIGSVQTYNSHNEQGNKRQRYKYFAGVKPGDLLLGYLTTPDKEIVAICQITKALPNTETGDAIEFRIVEKFREPVTWGELQSVPALAE